METKMHRNSLASYFDKMVKKTINKKENEVIEAFEKNLWMTDRECAEFLGYPHKSAVQPRITELVQKGVLTEAGEKRDDVTGRTVRIVALACRCTVEVEERSNCRE